MPNPGFFSLLLIKVISGWWLWYLLVATNILFGK
jgi:hypothetical protein